MWWPGRNLFPTPASTGAPPGPVRGHEVSTVVLMSRTRPCPLCLMQISSPVPSPRLSCLWLNNTVYPSVPFALEILKGSQPNALYHLSPQKKLEEALPGSTTLPPVGKASSLCTSHQPGRPGQRPQERKLWLTAQGRLSQS